MKKLLPILLFPAALALPAQAALIIYDGFDYTPLGSTNPNAAASSGQANGLPATNPGGSPPGTGTGLRNTWGTSTTVVTGLTYSNAGGTLATTANAGSQNNTGFSSTNSVYRFMTTDPFLSNRVAANGNFGVDGQSLYFSFLGQSSSATPAAFSFILAGSRNIYVENTATTWTLNDNKAGVRPSTGAFTINTTALLVVRVDFTAGANDVFNLFVNPTLGAPLGTPAATLTVASDYGFNAAQTRSEVANAMTFDEFRMGTTFADVSPIPEPSASVLLLSGVGGLCLLRRRQTR